MTENLQNSNESDNNIESNTPNSEVKTTACPGCGERENLTLTESQTFEASFDEHGVLQIGGVKDCQIDSIYCVSCFREFTLIEIKDTVCEFN